MSQNDKQPNELWLPGGKGGGGGGAGTLSSSTELTAFNRTGFRYVRFDDKGHLVLTSEEGGGFWRVTPHAASGLCEARLYQETLNHVQASHSEVPAFGLQTPSLVEAILDALVEPTAIYASRSPTGNSLVFGSASTARQGSPMYVVVRKHGIDSGWVATAHFRGRSYSSEVIWEKGDGTG